MRKAIASLIGGNLLSKILGLVREVIVAALFGTGYINGAYRVAQTGTLVPVNFLISDSLTAFIPLYKMFKKESINKGQLFFWGMLILFIIFSLVLTLFSYIFVDKWLNIIAPGLDVNTKRLAAEMLIIMAIGIPFYLTSALINYVEMAHDDFFPMSVRPSLQNLGMLCGAIFAYWFHNPLYLAWGFTLSYVLFFVWVLCRGIKANLLLFPQNYEFKILKEVIKKFWVTLRPLILLPVIYQGNIAVERAIATLISINAVSAIDYAKFITETLLLIVSAPVALAGLASWGGVQKKEMKIKMVNVFNIMLMVSLPISAFIWTHSTEIVTVLFARGRFDAESIHVTSIILFGMSLGLWAQAIGYVYIKALNAQLKNNYVMMIMSIGLCLNIIINIIFYKHIGAYALGLGYTVYGLVLLLGCLIAINIWPQIAKIAIIMTLGAVLYNFITLINFRVVNDLITLIVDGIVFLSFWFIILVGTPHTRRILKTLFSK
ncbi:murein biosynthesis integral membrane protein MurJ [Biostraticola tofi]|uniref:Putative peptidoglycan lipid II flippase n=1 Tax=Biostraticola tofi TaxID=466109 RepID=A0A4R3Z567_9GAMM|nr:lipid II flippase MurJ [Biostraticola tofi]TCW00209.1 putative peptidoglycan lipid II flippase [Biostraticola tofi]